MDWKSSLKKKFQWNVFDSIRYKVCIRQLRRRMFWLCRMETTNDVYFQSCQLMFRGLNDVCTSLMDKELPGTDRIIRQQCYHCWLAQCIEQTYTSNLWKLVETSALRVWAAYVQIIEFFYSRDNDWQLTEAEQFRKWHWGRLV